MPGETGATVVTNSRVFYFPREAAGALKHPAFPTPSLGRSIHVQLGRNASRGCEGVCLDVIARSEATKQSMQLSLRPRGLLRFARNDGYRTCRGCLTGEAEASFEAVATAAG
jgi:hypothetical protein